MTPRQYLYKNFFVVLAVDAFLLAASWYFAHSLRFNFAIPPNHYAVMIRLLPVVICAKIIIFFFFDLYRGMWRYTSLNDVLNIGEAATISCLGLIVLITFTHGFTGHSRSTFVIDWVLTILLISGYRAGIRLSAWIGMKDETGILGKFHLLGRGSKGKRSRKRLLIIGAGDSGEKIFREIQENASLRYRVVGFLDDDVKKVGKQIHGVRVYGTTAELGKLSSRLSANEILIAIPSATASQMRVIVARCKESGIPYKTIPGMGELINGKVSIKTIRDVAYSDLLGREPVKLDEGRIGAYLTGASVLVTGGGGSIGSELCRQICRFSPKRLVLYERSESPLFEIDLELRRDYPGVDVIAVLGDIRDRKQLTEAFLAFTPQTVFHAAAYKHVPMMELHPWKAVKNNIIGTRNVIDIAAGHGVDRFVLVSTDKAVRPLSVMGASKRAAELLVTSQNGCGTSKTKFMIVRFGNVLGSVGSVVPLFRKQIEAGGPVTVTHPDMTRYFMTIPEACQLILQAGAMGEGGEIFILEMGTPVKIADMARDLIRLSGFDPEVDIKVEYTGIRPGEKLYEELITEGEGIVPTGHEKILVLRGKTCEQEHLNRVIDDMAKLAYVQDSAGIKEKLKEIVEDYTPREDKERGATAALG
ncbi:MAG: polysaccharide biosynthesis protein [Deltaproteobacteria bacterium HGW-Deltaproteobacteria-21]|nr:MAG: polysaccharide biosynthesis protein [Deltaproteobacteria bacterium HGW-Deltaproteobacteria-21]